MSLTLVPIYTGIDRNARQVEDGPSVKDESSSASFERAALLFQQNGSEQRIRSSFFKMLGYSLRRLLAYRLSCTMYAAIGYSDKGGDNKDASCGFRFRTLPPTS
jgi:hypothetical protein